MCHKIQFRAADTLARRPILNHLAFHRQDWLPGQRSRHLPETRRERARAGGPGAGCPDRLSMSDHRLVLCRELEQPRKRRTSPAVAGRVLGAPGVRARVDARCSRLAVAAVYERVLLVLGGNYGPAGVFCVSARFIVCVGY